MLLWLLSCRRVPLAAVSNVPSAAPTTTIMVYGRDTGILACGRVQTVAR